MGKEIIIYCGNDNEFNKLVNPFQNRILHKHPQLKAEDVQVFKITSYPDEKDPTDAEKALFASFGPNDKITIVAHCSPNATSANKLVHYSQLARYLELRLDKNKIHNEKNNQSLKISLIMCNAGKGRSNNTKSFASQFHHSLGQLGLNTELTARIYLVNAGERTRSSGKMSINTVDFVKYTIALKVTQILSKIKQSKFINKLTPTKNLDSDNLFNEDFDLTLDLADKELELHKKYYKHQAPGSKVLFKWQQGEQKIVDAYNDKFKRLVHAFCEKHRNVVLTLLPNGNFNILQKLLTDDKTNADLILKIMILLQDLISTDGNQELKHIIAFGKRVISSDKKSQMISTGKRLDDQLIQPDITKTVSKMLAPLDEIIKELKKKEELSELVSSAILVRNMLKWKSNSKLIQEKDNAYCERVTQSLTTLLKSIQNMDQHAIQKNTKLFNHEVVKEGFFRKNRFVGNQFASHIKGILLAIKDAKRIGGNPLMIFGNFVTKAKNARAYQVHYDQKTKSVFENFNKSVHTVSEIKPKKK